MAVPMCPGCRALLSPEEAACPYCGWNIRATEYHREGGLVERAIRPLGGFVPAVMIANAILFTATVGVQLSVLRTLNVEGAEGVDGFMDAFIDPRAGVLDIVGGNVPDMVAQGQWWRLLCAPFLHGGFLHLLLNMLALRNMGRAVEEVYGTGKTLALYLGAGIAGNVATLAWCAATGSGGEVVRIGSSSGIFGIVGLVAALGFRIGGKGGRALWKAMFQSTAAILLIGFVANSMGGPIRFGNTGHAGGFLFGFAAGWVCSFGVRARGDLRAAKTWDAAALLLSLATIAAFVPPGILVSMVLSRN